jgi:hypothetical protein
MRFVLSFGILWLTSPLLAAADFCAAKVFVVDGSGKPVQTSARLIDPSGKVVESHATSDGSAEFCDFGFGDHTIRIGDDCVVTITDVRVHYGQQHNYSAIYNCPRRPGDSSIISGLLLDGDGWVQLMLAEDGGFVKACSVYLRISSEDGTKLAEAEVTGGTTYPNPIVADRFGRMFFAIPRNSTQRIAISALGYSGESIDVTCEERAVALHKNP